MSGYDAKEVKLAKVNTIIYDPNITCTPILDFPVKEKIYPIIVQHAKNKQILNKKKSCATKAPIPIIILQQPPMNIRRVNKFLKVNSVSRFFMSQLVFGLLQK